MSRVANFLRSLVQSAVKPKPVQKFWAWLDTHVSVPLITGSKFPGPLDTKIMPPFRGLYEKYADSRTRFFTFVKSARVGGTLFCICLILEKIGRWPGPILYVAPTLKNVMRFSMQELQPHMLECPPVAKVRIPTKTHWTKTEMVLKVCSVGLVSAGSVNQLASRQAELLIIDEADKIKTKPGVEAPPTELAIVRTKQFTDTRKVVRTGTPTKRSREVWMNFLVGSQEHCYLSCPECKGMQRLTFFREEGEPDRWMRVDADDPILDDPRVERKPDRKGSFIVKGVPRTGRVWWPSECLDKATKVWNADEVERFTRYECAFCEAKIHPDKVAVMLRRYKWRAHHPDASVDHISAHISALYSPFERLGALAKKYILALGQVGKMQDFYNSDLGLPFDEENGRLDNKAIANLIKASPEKWLKEYRRTKGGDGKYRLPFRPAVILMQVDVQDAAKGFWWTLTAHDYHGALYVLDWGPAVSWDDIDTIAARSYWFEEESFEITQAAEDMGHRTTEVYEHCINTGNRFLPFQGRHVAHGQYQPVRQSTVTHNGYSFPLYQFLDALWKDELYIRRMKRRYGRGLHLPAMESDPGKADGTDQMLIDQLTDEKKIDGAWESENDNNHLGDCLKMALVLESFWIIHVLSLAHPEAAPTAEAI